MMLQGLAVLQVAISGLGAWALGRRCTGSRWCFPHPALQVAADSSIGFLLVSYVSFALSAAGLANATSFWTLFFALAVVGAFEFRRVLWPALKSRLLDERFRGAIHWLLILCGSAYAVWIVLVAVLPPTGIDELTYHLEVPRRILENGGATLFPDNIRAYFPQLGEMLFLYGMAIGGELAAKLFHALFGLLLTLALYGFCRAHVSRRMGLLASALFLSVPSVMVISSWAYVDLHFALYGFLALAAVLKYLDERDFASVLVAGVMAGGAWATKYTGMQLLLLLLLLVLIENLTARDQQLPVAAPILPAVAFLVFLPYPLRNWIETGWPLYPFNLGFFSLDPQMNWDVKRSELLMAWLAGFGSAAERSVSDVVLAPLLVFFRARFDAIEAYDGFVGPAFLLVPLLLARGSKPRNIRIMVTFSLIFLFYWTVTTRQVRFLIPILPVLCFLLAFGLSSRRSRFLTGLVVVLIVGNLAVGVHQVLRHNPWSFWTGKESREEYLTRRVGGYPLYQMANRTLGPDDQVFLVNMRNFVYLLDCRWRADFVFQYYTLGKALRSASSVGEIARYFRSREVTHVMIDEDITLTLEALERREIGLLESFLREYGTLVARNPLRARQSLWRLSEVREGSGS